jgi:tricorn protease
MSASSSRVRLAGAVVAFALLATALLATAAIAKPGYLGDPDLYADQVVFVAEDDLWLANLDGSDVHRLTTYVGRESAPAFSPDGKWLAFTGHYDGNRDVYVMPVAGGEPRRLTWHPGNDAVLGWTPDGEQILFASARQHPHGNVEVFTVPFAGGDPQVIPIGRANYFDIDPESGRYAFTRTGRSVTRKRYRGGTAADIWVGDPRRADYVKVTDFDGSDIYPMWHKGRIYFLCDQGGTMNIWSMKADGSDRQRHTNLGKWDAGTPGMGPDGRIVFTLAGDVHVFDPASGHERKVDIDLPSERILTRVRYPEPDRYLTGFALSPDGERLAIVTRGEVFSVPVEEGVTLSVTRGSGAREKGVGFGAKGKRVVYVTDASGEEEIVTADAWGRGETKDVRKAKKSHWLFAPMWSPDGKWIAYADQTHTLYVVEADGGSPQEVDRSDQQEIRQYVWSPDGRWLAYMKVNRVEIGSIFIYDTVDGVTHQVTSWNTDDDSPAWDPDGRYLYFLSQRFVNPLIGIRDFESVMFDATKLYMLLLRPDVENPFAKIAGMPPKDEDGKADKEKDKDKAEEKKDEGKEDEGKEDEEKLEPVEIEFDGLADRLLELSVDAGQYRSLAATADKVFYVSWPLEGLSADIDFSNEPEPKGTLMAFDLEEEEASTFVSGISAYELQAKGGKLVFMKSRGDLYVVGTAAAPGDLSDSKVSLDGIVLELDPREEWRQIFMEGWRNMRDFYWDASMSGVDWEAIRDQYAELLPRIATRDDLRDLIYEMIGELATSHTYTWGGDQGRRVPGRVAGLLGAELVRDGDAYRVERIYRGDAADRIRSPLDEPGVDVKEGDYILVVNRQPFRENQPFSASLDNLAGKEVVLTVNDEPVQKDARDVVVEPMGPGSEAQLRYADWVRRCREQVAEQTDGRIGYIHLPDMAGRGLIQFDTWFYPQLDKEGMVVDMRWNAGGFVSQMIVSRLLREVIWFSRSRGGGVYTYPDRLLNGPFVVLVNEHSGSDGDFGPAAIQLVLGDKAPVIGKRSWGGVIGIRGDKLLVDGGMETQPEFAPWRRSRGGWFLENRGVEPQIEVENLPQHIARGIDDQLDRGIQEVMKLHEEYPPEKPDFGPAPNRSRSSYRGEGS